MKKLTTILIIFAILFLVNPRPAKASIFSDIGEYLKGLVLTTFAPKYEIYPYQNRQTTDYGPSKNSGGYAKRVIPESLNNEMKLQYLADYVSGKYKDIENLATCPGASTPVSLKQLAVYAITHYGLPLDKTKTDEWLKENNKTPLSGDSACFDRIFDNFYNTPQANTNETLNSELTNTVIKMPIPDAKIINSESKTIDNSKKNTSVLHRNIIPDQADPTLDSAKAENLYQNFLIPERDKK